MNILLLTAMLLQIQASEVSDVLLNQIFRIYNYLMISHFNGE